ncbi:TPA: hypothetical protein ACHVH4_002379 [Streptococcus suis]
MTKTVDETASMIYGRLATGIREMAKLKIRKEFPKHKCNVIVST